MLLIEQTTVPSSALPIAEFREHLKLGTGFADDGFQDSVLETCLRSAISAIEARTGKALISRQFLLSVSGWRAPGWHPIPLAPANQVLSVSTVDAGGTASLVDSGVYSLQKDLSVPRLVALGALPNIPHNGAAEVVFEAGYGADFSDMPGDLLQAVYVLAADYYDHRGGRAKPVSGLPEEVQALIQPYQPVRITGGASS